MASHARKSMSNAVHSGGREQPCGEHGRPDFKAGMTGPGSDRNPGMERTDPRLELVC